MPEVPTTRDYRKLDKPAGTETEALLGNAPDPRPIAESTPAPAPTSASPDFRQLMPMQGRVPNSPMSETDSLLGEPAAPASQTDSLLSGVEDTQKFQTAVQYGADKSPNEAARILRLKEATALPEDLIERNTDKLMRMTRRDQFDAHEFAKRSPITSEWLSESPNRTAATWDILPTLGRMEDFFTKEPHQYARPIEQLEKIARARAKKRLQEGYDKPHRRLMPSGAEGAAQFEESYYQEELAKLREQEAFISGDEPVGIVENTRMAFNENKAAALPHFNILGKADNATQLLIASQALIANTVTPEQMELLTQTARINAAAQRRGLTTPAEIAAAAASSFVFSAEFATTPGYHLVKGLIEKGGVKLSAKLATKGIIDKALQLALKGAGWAAGSQAQSLVNPGRIIEGTISNVTPRGSLSEDGKSVEIDPTTGQPLGQAIKNAVVTDFANVASERTGEAVVLMGRVIGKTIFSKLSPALQEQVINLAAKIPRTELSDKVGKVLEAGGFHGIGPEMIETEIGKLMEAAGGVKPYEAPSLHELGVEAAAFSIPGVVHAAARKVGEAKTRTKGFTDYGNNVKKVMEADVFKDADGKAVLEKFLGFQAENAGRPSVLMPIEAWNQYWIDKGQDPGDAAVQIIGSREGYDEANENGTDLVIPTAKWAVNIGPTEHNKFFAKELRWKELEHNEREAEEERKAIEQAEADAQKDAAEPKEPSPEVKQLQGLLVQSGVAEDQALANAQALEKLMIGAGMSPKETMLLYPLFVQQGTPTKKDGGLEQEKITEPEPHVLEQSKLIDGTNVIDASETFKAKQEEGKSPLEIHLGEAPRVLTNGELDDISAELEVIKKAIEDEAETEAQISRRDFLISVLEQSKQLAQLAERPTIESFKARFSDRGDKAAKKAIDKAQDPKKGPYVSDPQIPGIGWTPNYAAEPTGVIGPARISLPHVADTKETDPFKWSDAKYRLSYELIKKHGEQGIPLVINTSSDLVGHDDYIEAMPEGTVVNMYLLPDMDGSYTEYDGRVTNRILFPASPSRLRQESAIAHLREAGITVNAIEPTVEDVIKAAGGKTKIAKKLGVKSTEVEVEIKKAMGKHLRIVTLDQSALPAKSDLSPLGFYSQVAREVEKMDFKEMPAKDLWNRIKNIQGIKAEELEQLGLEEWLKAAEEEQKAGPQTSWAVFEVGQSRPSSIHTSQDFAQQEADYNNGRPGTDRKWEVKQHTVTPTGKVSKEEVLDFIRSNGVQVEQVVLADNYESDEEDSDDDTPHIADLEWSEAEFMSYSDIANQYYGSDPASEEVYERLRYGDEFEGAELHKQLDEWVAELKEDESEIYDTVEGLVSLVKNEKAKYDERRTAMKKLIGDYDFLDTSHGRYLMEKMEEAEIEYIESGESVHSIEKAELETLGLTMTRRYDSNWEIELPNGRTFETDTDDFNEAKIQVAQKLLEDGHIRGDESDLIQPSQIVFLDAEGQLPSARTVEKKAKELYKKEGNRLRAAVPADELYGDTEEEKEKDRESSAIYAAKEEVKAQYSDPTNKKNSITIKIKHPFLNGTVTGNNVKGWNLDAKLERQDKRIVENLGQIPAEQVQAKVLEVLKANEVFGKSQAQQQAEDPAFDVNAPTGRTMFTGHVKSSFPGAKNFRELVYKSPNAKDYRGNYDGKDHYRMPKQLASAIIADATGPNGEKVLLLVESQSDRHSKIRNLRLQIAALKEEIKDAAPDAPERKDAEEKIAVLESQIESIAAPYENTEAWLGLVMKNIFRIAVQQGYDAVAWTPAASVTKRWGTDQVTWAKKTGGFAVTRKDGQKTEVAQGRHFTSAEAGWKYIYDLGANGVTVDSLTVSEIKDPYWLVSTSAQVGGEVNGMNLEEAARERGLLLEKHGERITSLEELEKLVSGESDNPSFAKNLWKRMQTEESGLKASRKEGYEFEYDNLLPKKVVPAILKKLDKNAKVGVGKILSGNASQDTHHDFEPGDETNPDQPKQDVWQVVLTDEMKAKAKNEGFSLFQPSQNDSDARGQIKLYNDRAVMILPTWSDASTVPHEFAHYFLQIMGILSEMPDASQKVKDRYAAALKFLGVESKDQLLEEHHEKFARSFESYLLNGEAPTAQLKDLFKQFKEWLKAVYKAAPPEVLTPEAKEFFDSIFAAEAEVEQARAQQMMTPLFKDMKAAGFSETQALEMQKVIQEAQEASQAELTAKTFQEADKKRGKEYEENRELVRSQIEEEVSHQPVYIALSILQKGTMPDGTELPESLAGLKLDAKALKKEWPGQMKSLPKPYVYAREGGVHPDVAAEMLGFGSGSELITAMVEAEPMNQLVDRLTDEQMKAQFPSLQETGALSVEAMKAIHNDKQDELYRKELEYMLSEHFAKFKQMTRRIAGRPPAPTASIKEQAAEAIAKKQVRETNPLLYQRAEAKAGKEAADLLLKGDFAGAVEAKTRQRYNHALYRAAVEAKENAEKAAEYMRKFDKASVRERMGKAGSDYLEQIEAILERFGFNTVSGKAIDRKNDLRAWVEAQREEGIAVDLPEKLLSEAFRKNYKELTNAELAEVRETVENIEHLARLKNKLLTNEKVREIEEAEAMLLSTIEAHHQLKDEVLPLAPGLKDKILQNKSKFFAAHTRMEFLFEFLDGVKSHGAFWNLMFKPFVEAEAAEAELAKKDTEALARIFSVYTRAERAEWFGKPVFIAEAKTDKFDGNINKAGILAIALNWGNEYNRQALMEGYGWDERQVLKILEQLDEKDVATVNALWAHIDTYWEAARDLQKEMTGVAPQKVQGSPAVIRAGKLNGGYYPIKFDHDRSYRQLQLDEKAALGEQFGHATRAMTRHGHLIERTSTGGKPLLLNLTVLSGHLSQVRHDVTHRRAIIDVGKLVNRPKIRAAIIGAAGSQMYRQLNPWLKGIAGDTSPDLVDGWEPILSLMRTNMTKVNLGLKATSGLVQTLGYFNAAHVLGVKYARRGLRALNPVKLKENWAFITERSAMMKNRLDNYDRDVRDIVQKQNVVQGADDAWFYHIGFMDLALSVPAWMGAYEKAMDGEVENIDKGDEKSAVEYADSTVRKTMAAGAAKDLAQVQRGNELKRLFTAFYSQLSIQFNLLQQAGQHFALTKDFGRLASAATFLWFLPAILDDVIKGRGPDDEDEWLPWVTKKAATYPFQTMVFMRDIVNMMERRFETGRRADYTMSPVVQGIESVANASYSLAKPLMGEELTRGDAKDVTMAAGYMVGLPSRQVWMTSEYLYDYMTGEVQPSNPAEAAWRALVTGKPKEK